ncbi:MAG: hypothetical protein KME20_05215 [Kaiparowitsia implicata GSE-PSE-MK54-09C]|jgi:MinD-like ATPase involved in chromosome partitioning or flagellar assembly|nr:hypothetical protein [Kaiparowitsia implicata GSE-PSE-MK54-09C]
MRAILGLEPEETAKTLNNYLWGDCTIDDAAYDVSDRLAISNRTLMLVPSSAKADDIAP